MCVEERSAQEFRADRDAEKCGHCRPEDEAARSKPKRGCRQTSSQPRRVTGIGIVVVAIVAKQDGSARLAERRRDGEVIGPVVNKGGSVWPRMNHSRYSAEAYQRLPKQQPLPQPQQPSQQAPSQQPGASQSLECSNREMEQLRAAATRESSSPDPTVAAHAATHAATINDGTAHWAGEDARRGERARSNHRARHGNGHPERQPFPAE